MPSRRRPPTGSSAAPRRKAPRQAAGRGSAVAHGSRPEHAYARLRDLIVEGRLEAGSRIVETDIAERLGISRTPVREALQRLQQEGYVVAAPGAQQARLTVAPLTRTDVHDLLGIVGALEGVGAHAAASLPQAERRALGEELRRANAEFDAAGRAAPPDHGALYDSDERLHRRIVQAGGGPRLLGLHDAVKPQAERYIRMYISRLSTDIQASVDEHDSLIAAIEEGRPDDAERAVQLNWRHAAERLARVIAE